VARAIRAMTLNSSVRFIYASPFAVVS